MISSMYTPPPTRQTPAFVSPSKSVITATGNGQQQDKKKRLLSPSSAPNKKKKRGTKIMTPALQTPAFVSPSKSVITATGNGQQQDKKKRLLSPSSTPNKKKKRGTKIMTPALQELRRQAEAISLDATNFLIQKKNVTDEIKQHKRMGEQQYTPNAGTCKNALPEMASQYFPFDNNDTTPRRILHQLFLQLTETVMDKFEDHIMTIVPLSNNARMNHQSKQALRIFFGRDGEIINDDVVERYIYGPKAVLTTTGLHPSTYRVYPFTPLLIEIVNEFTKIIKQDLGPEWADFEFDFNFMEIKCYQGKDMFRDENGNPIKDDNDKSIRDDNNLTVRLHNDLNFNDNGKQCKKDTARGDHPIATYNVGSTRKLVFRWLKKEEIGNGKKPKWKIIKKCTRVIELEDGSIFVLLPADETPQAINDVLFKTQHEGKFSHKGATGMSLGFVFRSVKSKSLFNRSTNCWQWDLDKKYKKIVNGSLEGKWGKKHEEFPVNNPKTARDVNAVKENVNKFINNLKTLYNMNS
jgi:hypothetical protein